MLLCLFIFCTVWSLEKELLGQAGVAVIGGEGAGLDIVSMTDSMSPRSPTVIMVAHFLQSLTHRLVLGGELVYHRRPGEEGAILTLAGKYSGMGRSEVVVVGGAILDFSRVPGLCYTTVNTPSPLYFGFYSCTLGSYIECGIRRGPCKLLPQGK